MSEVMFFSCLLGLVAIGFGLGCVVERRRNTKVASSASANNAMDAIAEHAAAFILSVRAEGSYVQFLNQFVDYVRQQHQ